MVYDEEDYEESEDYSEETEEYDDEEDEDEEKNIRNIFGTITIFGFVSVIGIFIACLLIVSTNDYVVNPLYDLVDNFSNSGIIPNSFRTVGETMGNSYPNIINYLDYY